MMGSKKAHLLVNESRPQALDLNTRAGLRLDVFYKRTGRSHNFRANVEIANGL